MNSDEGNTTPEISWEIDRSVRWGARRRTRLPSHTLDVGIVWFRGPLSMQENLTFEKSAYRAKAWWNRMGVCKELRNLGGGEKGKGTKYRSVCV